MEAPARRAELRSCATAWPTASSRRFATTCAPCGPRATAREP